MKYNDEYWSKRFNGDENPKVVNAIKRIYNSYPVECMPQGTADPMYLMNVICKELGVGDGMGNFNIN